jgi:SNF2 family DNA or RNA helicase
MLGVEPITGATKVERRQELADTFQNGKAKVIVATIGSFSTGVNLHSASNMVFNDFSWVPGIMEQAKFRIIRVGQKDRCTFHYIMGSFQDEYIFKRLKEKLETIGAVV